MLPRFNIILLILIFNTSFSQDLEKEELKYAKEASIGINTNTNGGLISGINLRFTQQTAKNKFNLFSLEFVNVKHEKEILDDTQAGGTYIPWKIKHLLAFRPSYGKEITLFNKYSENGVRVNFTYSAGPTLGFVKPYMIEWIEGKDAFQNDIISVVPYNPNIHNFSNIENGLGIFNSFQLAKLNVGAHARTSFNFEYGPENYFKLGLETGTTFEAYSKKNRLYYNSAPRWLYSAFFLHLYYGLSF